MYGIVNKSIEYLVKTNYGEEKWDAVKLESGITIDFFVSSESYDDDITYKLAGALSVVINIPVHKVLEIFGQWWILKTGREKYGHLMEAGGKNLKQFLVNLPLFHNRIMLIYPRLTPPEFRISHIEEQSLHVHYYSLRKGLKEFVRGLLLGLGQMYEVPVTVEMIDCRENGSNHETFKVSW